MDKVFASLPAYFPVITLILGFILSEISQSWKTKKEEQREKEENARERQQVIDDRRAAFQRETLLLMSATMSELVEVVDTIYLLYKYNEVGGLALDSDLSKRYRTVNRDFSRYRQRVLDEELRKNLEKMQLNGADILFSKTRAQLEQADKAHLEHMHKASERLGFLLRELY